MLMRKEPEEWQTGTMVFKKIYYKEVILMSERPTGCDGSGAAAVRQNVTIISAAEGRHFFQFEGDQAKAQRVPDYVIKGIPAEKSMVPNMNA